MLRQRSPGASASESRDVAGRGGDIGLAQRHDLRPRRRARGVEDERDVGGSARPGRRGGADRASPGEREGAGRRTVADLEAKDGDAEPLGDGDRRARRCPPRRGAPWRREIGEVELELLGAIGRVERRGGRGRADGEEGRGHLRSVRQHDRDAVVPADAEPVEACGRVADEAAERAIAERSAARRHDGRRLGGAAVEKIEHVPKPRLCWTLSENSGAGPQGATPAAETLLRPHRPPHGAGSPEYHVCGFPIVIQN